MAEEEENFERGDAGSSLTYQKQASHLKKNDHAMLKGNPCRVLEMTTAKAGKHGAAKASIVGTDIFTNKKYEDSCPSTHNIDCPTVRKTEYTLLDIADDGFLSLLRPDGELKNDLKLPTDEDSAELVARLKEAFAADKEILCVVMEAMAKEKLVDFREANK